MPSTAGWFANLSDPLRFKGLKEKKLTAENAEGRREKNRGEGHDPLILTFSPKGEKETMFS